MQRTPCPSISPKRPPNQVLLHLFQTPPQSPISHFPQITQYLARQGCCTPIRVPILSTISYNFFPTTVASVNAVCQPDKGGGIPPISPSDPPNQVLLHSFQSLLKNTTLVSPLRRGIGSHPPSHLKSPHHFSITPSFCHQFVIVIEKYQYPPYKCHHYEGVNCPPTHPISPQITPIILSSPHLPILDSYQSLSL